MSIGTFGTGLSTQYRFGLALSTKPKGVIMDIDRILKQTVDKDNVRAKVTAYNLATGPSMSLNENLIPEQLFDDPKTTEKEAQGISAVKALQIAAQQGQTIYTVTKANYAEILPKLNHSTDVMTDVKNAINAGKEVTISQTQVHAFGWSGTGYIVLDPKTGVGGYLIGGGADGGWLNFFGDNQNFIVFGLGLLALASLSFPFLGLIVTMLTIFSALMITAANNLALIESGCPDWYIAVNSLLNFLAIAVGVFLSAGVGEIIFSTITGWIYTSAASSQMVHDSCRLANR